MTAQELQWLLTTTRIDEWLRNDVFGFRWWLLLGVFAVSVYAWLRMADKSRLSEIGMFAVLVGIITLVLDELGVEMTLWDYPTDLIPLFPPLTAIDLASLPMVYSLIFQRFGTWKSFIMATIFMAALFCFVLEPIFVWVGVYQTLTWKYQYGFPIYITMAIVIRWLVTSLSHLEGGRTQVSNVYKAVGGKTDLG